jgi:hypothetical protein
LQQSGLSLAEGIAALAAKYPHGAPRTLKETAA